MIGSLFTFVLPGLIVLSVLVFIHELGHFLVAKLFGVRVDEFGFGYPPRLIKLATWRGTEYTINAIPFGGFVRYGESDPSRPDAMASQSAPVRALAISAGPIMNILLAIFCFTLVFMFGQQYLTGRIEITEVAPGSPAEQAALQVGDHILEINGVAVHNTWELRQQTELTAGRETSLLIERGGQQIAVSLVPRPRPPAGEGPMGVAVTLVDVQVNVQRYPVWQALPAAVRKTGDTIGLVFSAFSAMFRGAVRPEVTGPVGIVQATGEVAKSGWVNLLEWMAILSINFSLFNLIPFPALDGGRLLFILVEVIRGGKRLEVAKEDAVHVVGFLILIGLMFVVLYRDIVRLVSGESPLP